MLLRGDVVSDEQLVALKERAAAELMRIPGVTAVGLGGRIRDGRPTGEIVLKVFVERKLPLDRLTPGKTLPPAFEGVGVDVGELPLAEAGLMTEPLIGDPLEIPGSPPRPESDLDRAKHDVLTGGIGIQSELQGAGFATMGCLLEHETDPGRVYALIQLDPGTRYVAEIAAGTVRVRKRGAHTRRTGGRLDTTRMTLTVEGVTHTNVILTTPNPNPSMPVPGDARFSQGGDSGSVLIDDDSKVVALHYAGLNVGNVHRGFGLPIEDIIASFSSQEHLPLRVATSTVNGDVRTVLGARPVGAPPALLPTGGLPPVEDIMASVGADLRRALDRTLRDLPDPAGLTYPQMLTALAAS